MSTIIAVSRQELDDNPALKAQLQSVAEQMSTLGDEYSFLPLPEYEDSFIRMLETNHIPHYIPEP